MHHLFHWNIHWGPHSLVYLYVNGSLYMLQVVPLLLQEISGKFDAIESGGRIVLNESFSAPYSASIDVSGVPAVRW